MPQFSPQPNSNSETTRYSLPKCTGCGGRVTGIQTAGPGVHRASPCGCDIGTHSLEVLRDLDEPELAPDGGFSGPTVSVEQREDGKWEAVYSCDSPAGYIGFQRHGDTIPEALRALALAIEGTSEQVMTDGGEELPHHCDICGRDFATLAELINHACEQEVATDGGQIAPADLPKGFKQYVCAACGCTELHYYGSPNLSDAIVIICSECGADGVTPKENFEQSAVADGGLVHHPDWSDLHGFARDCVRVLNRLEEEEGPTRGVDVKVALEEEYDREITNPQLYPTLDHLGEQGLVAKSEHDGRTNDYQLTDAGRKLLEDHAWTVAQDAGLSIDAVRGGENQ